MLSLEPGLQTNGVTVVAVARLRAEQDHHHRLSFDGGAHHQAVAGLVGKAGFLQLNLPGRVIDQAVGAAVDQLARPGRTICCLSVLKRRIDG